MAKQKVVNISKEIATGYKSPKLNANIVVGLLCIVIALVVGIVYPVISQKIKDTKVPVVTVKSFIPKGTQIAAEQIKIEMREKSDIGDKYISDTEKAVNMFAKSDIYADDYISDEKLSYIMLNDEKVYESINENKRALAINIADTAGSIAYAVKPNDIVTIFAVKNDMSEKGKGATLFPQLKYVKVLSVARETNTSTESSETDTTTAVAKVVAVTLEVSEGQAQLLAGLNYSASLHLALVSRKNDTKALKLLEEQEMINKKVEQIGEEPLNDEE